MVHAAVLPSSTVRRTTFEETLAIGDGANDLAMIDAAGLGIAFCAKPNVQKTVNAPEFPGGSTLNVQRLDLAVRKHTKRVFCMHASTPMACLSFV